MNKNAVQEERGPRKNKGCRRTSMTSRQSAGMATAVLPLPLSSAAMDTKAALDHSMEQLAWSSYLSAFKPVSPRRPGGQREFHHAGALWPERPHGHVDFVGRNNGTNIICDASTLLFSTAQQIMGTALRRTIYNHIFKSLHPHDQLVLLETKWSELFLFAASYWPIDISRLARKHTQVQRDQDGDLCSVQKVITACQSLQADSTELPFLETILLLRQDPMDKLLEAAKIETLQDQAQLALAHYVTQRHLHNPARFGKMLLTLSVLRTVTPDVIEKRFFSDVIGTASVRQIIRSYLI
ncbi:nuclear receptor subfamily 2 group E member 1-like [Gigantopelta aegis]|uniref:nuclear receptor subfamily 2 group E member 1-like n=1 Tax=Gigantopelta aegis TaxID=1735272 RepID=UPI001B88CBDF|nr:nuclear receptor subfamily 2 group E member 1-like [Gigantopelta aegis]